MSFYIRYVLTDARGVTRGELEAALQQVDPDYAIEGDLIRAGELKRPADPSVEREPRAARALESKSFIAAR